MNREGMPGSGKPRWGPGSSCSPTGAGPRRSNGRQEELGSSRAQSQSPCDLNTVRQGNKGGGGEEAELCSQGLTAGLGDRIHPKPLGQDGQCGLLQCIR